MPNGNQVEYVLKIFKGRFTLQYLQKQWPRAMLRRVDGGGILTTKGGLHYDGTLLPDGRFVFRMQRSWGDWRKLIDMKMQQNANRCTPFTEEESNCILLDIAEAMKALHGSELVHRDVKASNVLVYPFWEGEDLKVFDPTLHRFFCDVSDYDYVIGGGRPQLPGTIKSEFKVLLNRCWHADATERPTFQEILDTLVGGRPKNVLKLYQNHMQPNEEFIPFGH